MKELNVRKITSIASSVLIALALIGMNSDQVIAKDKSRRGTAKKAVLRVDRKNVAGADAFSIDIGTSENLRSQVGSARRKTAKHKR